MPQGSALSSWLVAHLGAREHYATARALHSTGRLASLATDWWRDGVPSYLRRGPLRMVSSRFHPGIPTSLVRHPSWISHLPEYLCFKSKPHSFSRWLHSGGNFSTWVASSLRKGRLGSPAGVLAYSGGGYELFGEARRLGLRSALMQVDPGPLWYESYREAWEQNPEMEEEPPRLCPLYRQRLEKEWDVADLILVNSAHSRERVAAAGAPSGKLRVLPLSFEGSQGNRLPRILPTGHAFTVLWAGHVSLIKGFAAFHGAAQALAGSGFKFVCAGTIGLKPAFVAKSSAFIEFKGKVPRSDMESLYDQADLFAFPTLSDGFGMVQLEAMSRGLPVVSTSCCGQVVEDGVNGFAIPTNAPQALAAAIARAASSPGTYSELSSAALRTSACNGLEILARRLGEVLP